MNLTDKGIKEIFNHIPDNTECLQTYFDLIKEDDFKDLLKICNRDCDDISELELSYLTKVSIGLVLLELNVSSFPEESLDKFVNNFRTSVIIESLRRKQLIEIVGKVSIVCDYQTKLTNKGKLVHQKLK